MCGARLRRLVPVLLGLLVVGCSNHEEGAFVGNLQPHVRFTGGPQDGARANHTTTVYWTGWDDDGRVIRYEYALDPPLVFTPEEIAHPERFADIRINLRRGPKEHEDTLLVSKTVDGVDHSYRWIQTVKTDQSFTLDTTVPDSTNAGYRMIPDPTFHGTHRIYLRGMDNEGLYSDAERLGFTAESYTPTSWLSFPDVRGKSYLNTGLLVTIRWYGYDPDPPAGTDGQPPSFLYKLIDLRQFDPPLSIYRPLSLDYVVYELSRDIPWEAVSGDERELRLNLPPSEYLFVVRAVDETGAIEPFVALSRPGKQPGNAFLFEASQYGGLPEITLNESTLGTWTYRGNPRTNEVEVPVRLPLRFSWSASANNYGGKIQAYSYGLDVPDLERDGPGSKWTAWGPVQRIPTAYVFTEPGVHVFYVRARDESGTIQYASLVLRVFDFPLDRPLLLVDDYRNTTYPLDRQHDAWWEERLAETGRFAPEDLEREQLWFDAGSEGDRLYLDPAPPKLSLLGRYQKVVFIIHGKGWCAATGLFRGGVMGSAVRAYSAVGGKVWVEGQMSAASLIRGFYDCNDPRLPFAQGAPYPAGEATYPHRPYVEGDLSYDLFKLVTERMDNDKGENWEDTMVGVAPWAGSPFPAMKVDSTKFHASRWKTTALTHVDAISDPIFVNQDPSIAGDLDSLYAYKTASYVRPKWRYRSQFENKLCAVRWHDPDPAREYSRNMWFGFPLYYMENDKVVSLLNTAFDWLDDEDPPVVDGEALRRALAPPWTPPSREGLPDVPLGTLSEPDDTGELPRN